MLIAGYNFDLIGEIRPATSHTGDVIEYAPQVPWNVRLNRYAGGPFCRFRVKEAPKACGVYAIKVGDELKYIGQCADLSERFGPNGYGTIAARNCHSDGQATNCKINASILKEAKARHKIVLWFHASSDYKAIEKDMISRLDPPWNGRREGAI